MRSLVVLRGAINSALKGTSAAVEKSNMNVFIASERESFNDTGVLVQKGENPCDENKI